MSSPSLLTPQLAIPAPLIAARLDLREHTTAAVSADARRWCALAFASLVIAGLLSLAVVIGRLPILSRIIDDPLFFKRCLVVHVDLSLVVWFYAFLAGLLALRNHAGPAPVRTVGFILAVGGVGAMLAGGMVRGAQPVLANYVPVIDTPLFGLGLAAFFVGTLLHVIHALSTPAGGGGLALPPDAALGLRAAAVTIVIAAATWVSARAGLPDGLDVYTRAEFLAWGPGHVLQAANAAAMLGVWLWLLERATGVTVLSRRVTIAIFAALVLPQAVMPLLTVRGTMDTLYHTGATQLMRWAIFPAILAVFVAGVAHLRQARRTGVPATEASRMARTGFTASATLALLGLGLGACIRSSTTLVPAHYHASLGAVTVAFMTAAYLVCEGVRRGQSRALPGDSWWRSARRQLGLFGIGQTVFALGFAIGGAYGLGRKTYAAEQHARSAGEVTGLIVMGVGGLVAVIAGLWFLFLVLRELRGWWRSATPAPSGPALSLP